MKLVVGLGNPGKQYERTRHNVGAELVGEFAKIHSVRLTEQKFSSRFGTGKVGNEQVLFLFPQTYMNCSGEAVGEALRFYKIEVEKMMVVHDDIDLALGRVKLDFAVGAAGHKGILSLIEQLGSQNFFRIRLGIGRPTSKEEVESYVLSPFASEEREGVETMKETAAKILAHWIGEGI